MLCFKKFYRDELLQLALLLSIFRLNQDSFYENDIYEDINLDYDNGTIFHRITPAVLRSHYVNPKSLDSVLLNYERNLFADLNSLGRFSRFRHPDVTAYLLNIERTAPASNSDTLPVPNNQQNQTEENVISNEASNDPLDVGINLTQEDMDLIEVLWKQDVDLGFSVENANPKPEKIDLDIKEEPDCGTDQRDDIDKLKSLQGLNEDIVKEEPYENEDPWAGLDYIVDTETGEYVVKGEIDDTATGAQPGPSCDLSLGDLSLPLPELFLNDSLQLDEAFRLVDLDDETSQETSLNLKDLANLSLSANATLAEAGSAIALPTASSVVESAGGVDELVSPSKDFATGEDDFDFLSDMMTPQFHHPHHRAAFQSRTVPFVRAVSMEQRWQDLANLLSLPSPADGSGIHHPFSHHHHHLHNYTHPHSMGYGADSTRGVLLHNATLTPPMGDLNSTVPLSNLGGTNIGSAVATSINLTNSSEPMGESSNAPHYKMEPSQEMYYQNGSEINQTDSGFLSSILNDEDLQLMDMAMNEGYRVDEGVGKVEKSNPRNKKFGCLRCFVGKMRDRMWEFNTHLDIFATRMYTMRLLDGNNSINNLNANGAAPMSRNDMERLDSSSDSAVSSMGSERVPSLSDGEWGDAGSDSGHTAEPFASDPSKVRPYDYSYSSRQLNNDHIRVPPVAQKKHQMYGKRYFQDHNSTSVSHPPAPLKYEFRDSSGSSYMSNQSEGAVGPKMNEVKYSCSIEFGLHNHITRNPVDHIQHNHSYPLSAESMGAMQRPVSRDKGKKGKSEDEHLTRDEKRARSLSIPITVDDIINLPMDEFNERLSKYDLSENQLSLIRDIRRRGKNKVAAQNCRKRKLDQILSLADEVKEMRDKKLRLINDHDFSKSECKRMKDKYQQLYRHVFQNLRDPDGNQYSPYQYSLQTSADGSILMVPRSNCTNSEQKEPPNQE